MTEIHSLWPTLGLHTGTGLGPGLLLSYSAGKGNGTNPSHSHTYIRPIPMPTLGQFPCPPSPGGHSLSQFLRPLPPSTEPLLQLRAISCVPLLLLWGLHNHTRGLLLPLQCCQSLLVPPSSQVAQQVHLRNDL